MSQKTILLPLLCLIPAFTLSSETLLYVTADIQGSLIGNECICGDNTAGLPALGHILAQRKMQSTFYIDAGGLSYPSMDDSFLLNYLDRALNILDVNKIIQNDTISNPDGEAFILRKAGIAMVIATEKKYTELKNSNADIKIWILRGSLNSLIPPTPPEYIDLVILTGTKSPGNNSQGGGVKGTFTNGIPWMSLAPKGNGMGIIHFSTDSPPEIEIITLEYGVSLELPAITELGKEYLTKIIEGVSE